jgi:hypothetical protein
VTAWGMVLIAVAGIAGSAAVNLLVVGMYMGRYRRLIEETQASAEESRKSLVLVREDVARIKGRLNFKQWTKEG